MTQLRNVADAFGEVNVYKQGDKIRVVATVLMEPHKEGAQTGIALDGSGSMSKLYGVDDGGGRPLSPLFGGPKKPTNDVAPVAQKLCAYLARRLDADGGTTVIYWAVGTNGGQVEVVGDFTAEQAERHPFGPPREFGTGTMLLPAVKYFVERFRTAPYGFYVFITDGELHDLDEVKAYSVRLARDVAAGRRKPLKFVLIGLGNNVNEVQMEELDDLDAGVDVDLWDHKLASEMRQLADIFAEVVDKNARVAESGRIIGPKGEVLKDFTKTGVPAYIEFEAPAGTAYFTLETPHGRVTQPLTDTARLPAQEKGPLPPTAPTQPPTPAQRPAPPPQRTGPTDLPPDLVEEAAPAKGGPADMPPDTIQQPGESEWSGLPLEFGPDAGGEAHKDVDLEKREDK
jgi:hypothetical protein